MVFYIGATTQNRVLAPNYKGLLMKHVIYPNEAYQDPVKPEKNNYISRIINYLDKPIAITYDEANSRVWALFTIYDGKYTQLTHLTSDLTPLRFYQLTQKYSYSHQQVYYINAAPFSMFINGDGKLVTTQSFGGKYGFLSADAARLMSNGIYTYESYADLRLFACQTTESLLCRLHSTSQSVNSMYFGGVFKTENDEICLSIHSFGNYGASLQWTLLMDQSSQGASSASFRYIQKMCVASNYLFAFAGSDNKDDGQLFRIPASSSIPGTLDSMDYTPGELTIAREIRCIDAVSAFIFIDKPVSSSYTIMQAKFESGNFQQIVFDFSGASNPFSSYNIAGAVFVDKFGSDAKKFLIYGGVSSFTVDSSTFSPASKHGFLYTFDDQVFETCYSPPEVSEISSTVANSFDSPVWSFLSASQFGILSPPPEQQLDYESSSYSNIYQYLLTNLTFCNLYTMNSNTITARTAEKDSNIFTASFPSFLYYKESCNSTISTSGFPMFEVDDGSGGVNQCETKKWWITWKAKKEGTTTTWDNKYPAISWNQNSNDFKIDFQDLKKEYLGTLEVTITGTLPSGDSQDVVIVVYNFDVRDTPHNLPIDVNDISGVTYHLFSSQKIITWTITPDLELCNDDLVYQVKFLEGTDWVNASDSILGTTGQLVVFPDNEQSEFTVETKQSTKFFDVYRDLRDTYTYRVYVYRRHIQNSQTEYSDLTKIEKDCTLVIDGCIVDTVVPNPDLTYVAFGPDQETRLVPWVGDDGQATSECTVAGYTIDDYSPYLLQLPGIEVLEGPPEEIRIWADENHIYDNTYSGRTYQIQLKATVTSVNPSYSYTRFMIFPFVLGKNCTSARFNEADYWKQRTDYFVNNTVVYVLTTYNREVRVYNQTSDDLGCRVDYTTTYFREGIEDVGDFPLLVTQRGYQSKSYVDGKYAYFWYFYLYNGNNETLVGNYSIEYAAAISPSQQGVDTNLITINIEIKHWCWAVGILKFANDSAFPFIVNAYVIDDRMPIMGGKQKYVDVQIPVFATDSITYNRRSYAGQSLIPSCGQWVYEISEYDQDGVLTAINGSPYTFTQPADVYSDPMILRIESNDKSLVTSSQGYNEYILQVKGYYSLYPEVYQTQNLSVFFQDSCHTLNLAPSLIVEDDSEIDELSNLIIYYKPVDPTKVIKFNEFIDTVKEYDPQTDELLSTHVNQSVCGPLSYELVNVTEGENVTLDEWLIGNMSFDIEDPTYRAMYIYTEDTDQFDMTTHHLVLQASLVYGGSHYPVYQFPFTLQISQCQVRELQTPQIYNYTYLLRTGEQTILADMNNYIQTPDCMYDPNITSYFYNGSQFNESIIAFTVDKGEKKLVWRVNNDDLEDIGTHRVVVNYTIPQMEIPYIDTSFQFNLIMKFIPPAWYNTPPYFMDFEEIPHQVQLRLGESKFIESGRPTSDTVDLEFNVESSNKNWKDVIKYQIDKQYHTIKLNIKPTIREHEGLYSINITLVDNSGDNPNGPPENVASDGVKTTTYKIQVIIYEDSDFISESQGLGQEENEDDDANCDGTGCNPVVEFEDITYNGLAKFKFTHNMQIPGSVLEWKGTNAYLHPDDLNPGVPLSVKVSPGLDQNETNLELDWQVKEMTKTTLVLQLNFKQPLFVNTGYTPDYIQILFLQKDKFLSTDTGYPILKSVLTKRMVGQMPLGSTTENILSATVTLDNSLQGTVIGNFVVNVMLSGSLQYLWGMINALQIVFHLPGISVNMPSNSKMIYGSLIEVTQFNLISEEWLQYFYFWNFFNYDSAKQSRRLEDMGEELDEFANLNSNLAEIGYESSLAIDNMETLFVMIQVYCLMVIAFVFCKILLLIFEFLQKKGIVARAVVRSFKWLMAFLFWNVPFRFMLEGYLELTIDCLINLKPLIEQERLTSLDLGQESTHAAISNFMSLILLSLLVAFPIFIFIYGYLTPEKSLKDEEMNKKIGAIFEGANIKDKRGVYYNAIFAFRRLILAYCLVMLSDQQFGQLGIFFVSQTALMIYIGLWKPRDTRLSNRYELANEFMTLVISYHLLMYTDYYSNIEVRYTFVGSSMIGFTGLIIFVNMSYLLHFFVLKLFSVYRYHQSKKRWIQQENYLADLHRTGTNASIYDPTMTVQERISKDRADLILQKKHHYHADLLKMEQMGLYMTNLQKQHLTWLNKRDEARKRKQLGKQIFSTQQQMNMAFGEDQMYVDSVDSDKILEQLEREENGEDLNPEIEIYQEAISHEIHFPCQQRYEKENVSSRPTVSVPLVEVNYGKRETLAEHIAKIFMKEERSKVAPAEQEHETTESESDWSVMNQRQRELRAHERHNRKILKLQKIEQQRIEQLQRDEEMEMERIKSQFEQRAKAREQIQMIRLKSKIQNNSLYRYSKNRSRLLGAQMATKKYPI